MWNTPLAAYKFYTVHSLCFYVDCTAGWISCCDSAAPSTLHSQLLGFGRITEQLQGSIHPPINSNAKQLFTRLLGLLIEALANVLSMPILNTLHKTVISESFIHYA